MVEAGPSEAERSSSWAKTLDAWIMVAGKALVVGVCGVAVLAPQWLPRVSQLIDSLGDVDFAGVKLHFDRQAEDELAKHGVVFRNGKMYVGGHDLDEIVPQNGELQSQIKILTDENQKLADALKQAAPARSATPSTSPVESPAPDTGAVIAQAQAATQKATQVAAAIAAQAPQAAGFGIVFSSDQDKSGATAHDLAMAEVAKVQAFFSGPITLYKRGKYLASVAYFDTRTQALAALPEFTAKLTTGPFAVNLGGWCPQPTTVEKAEPPIPEQKSCGF